MKVQLLVATLLLGFIPVSQGELIPAARLTNWTPGERTGVIGGIPTTRTNLHDVTQTPYFADNTGATDAQPAIQSAINDCPSGEVVYLPSGTYRIDGTLTLGTAFSGKTLRGAGPTATFIDQRVSGGITVGGNIGFSPPNVDPLKVTAGLTRGSETVTVSGGDLTSNLSVGQIIIFGVQNDETLPVVHVYNYDVFSNQPLTTQFVRIVSKDATHITFFPPLFDDYGGGSLEIRVFKTDYQANSVGIEDLTIDSANASSPAYSNVQFATCYGSWIKNCNILHAGNYPVLIAYSLNCEVRHSKMIGPENGGSNAAGIQMDAGSCLIEDNIILDSFPIIEVNGGSSGNVFAYNYGPPTGTWDTNHGPHNQFNLYEGNALGFQLSDGYFGSEANLTLFRNYMHGPYGINLRRFTRNVSAIGNMLPVIIGDGGLPNMGNGDFNGTAQLSQGDPWRDWHMTGTITTRTDDDHAVITLDSGLFHPPTAFSTQNIALTWGAGHDQRLGGHVTGVSAGGTVGQITRDNALVFPVESTVVSIGPGVYYESGPTFDASVGVYQEKDLDVAATLVKKGNRYADTNNFDTLSGDTLPNSLYRSSAPSWFFNLTWPPYDPVTPRTPSIEDIPAGYRYIHNVDPPSGGNLVTDAINATTGTILSPFAITVPPTSPVSITQATTALTPNDPVNSGAATYSFTVPSGLGGFYSLAALVNFSSSSADSFWVNLDFQPDVSMLWTGAWTTNFESRTATRDVGPAVFARRFYLNVGAHTIRVKGRNQAKLGTLSLTKL